MTLKSIDAQSEQPPSSLSQQETVVTHAPHQDTTVQRSVERPVTPVSSQLPGPDVSTSRTVVRDEVGGQQHKVAQITQVLWFTVGIFEVLLALRLVLKLTSAAEAAGFTQLILGITTPLVALFLGIFPNAGAGGYEFEPASVVAMVTYFLLGLGLARLVRIIYGQTREAV